MWKPLVLSQLGKQPQVVISSGGIRSPLPWGPRAGKPWRPQHSRSVKAGRTAWQSPAGQPRAMGPRSNTLPLAPPGAHITEGVRRGCFKAQK